MSYKHKRVRSYVLIVCLGVLLCSGAAARAQNPVDTGPARIGVGGGSPSLLKPGPFGELISIFTPRSPDEIRRRLDFARTNQENAERDSITNQRLVQEAEGRMQISNGELGTTKTRLSVAKKSKNEADKAVLEAELKRQKAEKHYLDALVAVVRADAAWLDSRKSAAESRVKALELEDDITRKYAEVSMSGNDSTSNIASYRQSLGNLLDAQKKAADRAEDASSREKDAVARRLKQLDELSKLKP